MKKTIEIYQLSYIETDDIHPTNVNVTRDEIGGLDISMPYKSRDRADLTKLLRAIADDLDKYFPN